MKGNSLAIIVATVFVTILSTSASAQSSSFNYQGRLQDGGSNANGSYDFQFTLWDALTGGTQQPQPSPVTVSKTSVAVANGVFTVQLDFGVNAFPGANRWLETSARLAGSGAFTILSPRQPITSTPYAMRSLSSATVDSVDASKITIGKISGTQITVPLQLSGDLSGQGVISAINNNSAGAGVYGRSNLTNTGGEFSAGVYGQNVGTGNGVYGTSNSSTDTMGGVSGYAPNGDGVVGRGGRSGVFGVSTTGIGVSGVSSSSSFAGVSAFNSNGGAGVAGSSPTGPGVSGDSTSNNGVVGVSSSGQGGLFQSDTGIGVSGRTNTPNFAAVIGVNDNSGDAVRGFTSNGIAIHGVTSNGFAGYFEGKSYFLGNVGMGTVAPAVPLEVRRDGAAASDWQQGQFRISGQANPARQLSLGYDTSSNLGVIQAGEAGVAFRNLSLNPSGGNVGINKTNPNFTLDINGTLSVGILGTGGSDHICRIAFNQLALCSSSIRYKTNIEKFSDGLGLIRVLAPVTFDWKSDGKHDFGLVAEDVEKVSPLLVTYNEGQVEGVKYDRISVVLINAVKEQQAQIQDQQEQLKRQQEQIKRQDNQAKMQAAAFAAQRQELDALKKLVCRSHPRATACR